MQLRPPPHRRARRLALHLAAVTALAGGGVLLTGAPGHAAAAARPDTYGGDATASALHVNVDRAPQVFPVADLFHVEVPYATTGLDSSGAAAAAAAPVYPGSGFLGLPGFLCQTPLCLPLPDYPGIAQASYPTQPDAKAQTYPGPQGSGPGSVEPGEAVAHADPDRVEATTAASAFSIAGQISATGLSAHSKQAFEGSTLVVTAESVVKGLDLGGGQLHIDSVRSVAVARVDGGAVTSATATTTVEGATAGGQAVSIDSDGVHVAGKGDGGALGGGANAALAALDASGISVRLTTPTKSTKDGAAKALTGGLLVTFAQGVDEKPPVPGTGNGDYFGSVTVAGAGVDAFAEPALDFPFVDVPPPPPPAGPVLGSSGGTATVPATTGVAVPPAPGPTAPAGGLPRPTLAEHRVVPAAVLGVDLSGDRVRALALALLGYPALVLVTAPLRTRPRRARRART